MPPGSLPIGTVAVTVLVAVLMTETVWSRVFTTYTDEPFGVMATAPGSVPTAIVVVTALVDVSMTDTVPGPQLVTYANGAAAAGPVNARSRTTVRWAQPTFHNCQARGEATREAGGGRT